MGWAESSTRAADPVRQLVGLWTLFVPSGFIFYFDSFLYDYFIIFYFFYSVKEQFLMNLER